MKNTVAPLGPVATIRMFDGQAMLSCGYTVTVKLHVALLPQVSLAVAVTVVVPIGKVLPLGGLATTVGGVQPPEAVTVKTPPAPLGRVAETVIFDGQEIVTCGYTVTVKLHVALSPQVSIAVAVTVVDRKSKR